MMILSTLAVCEADVNRVYLIFKALIRPKIISEQFFGRASFKALFSKERLYKMTSPKATSFLGARSALEIIFNQKLEKLD
jgi:hypothetical protein